MALKNTKVVDGDLLVLGRVITEGRIVDLLDLELQQEGNTLKSVDTFPGCHVHILVEYETNGIHYGTSADLHPYNGSICLSSYIIGADILTCYIDETGHIVLSIPNNMTLINMQAHYFIYN